MDKLKDYAVFFTAGIFFVALASLFIISLSLGFSWANSNFKELKAGQVQLEKRIDGMEVKINGMEVKINGMEVKIGGIEDRLDQVLFELKGHSNKPSKQAKK